MKYILDIETKPQENLKKLCIPDRRLKDPVKIELDIRKKMSVDTDLADIICIGIKELGQEAKLYSLKEMEQFFKNDINFNLITYNGKAFDIPLLIKQGIKNNLNFPYTRLKDMTNRYNTNHLDLMLEINERNWKSLDQLLQIYVGVSKTPIDFETATEEEIKEHCLEDLENSEKLYNKFKVML